ncbi:hypothetical protein DPMN_057516 [Dreissena polymorpha]|uniref:Uncharacterized protein n=1 Tax=Dreissena polymorpha TaxID=45954 RepID=A0A9D4HC38_DREPO|nr:hypothetical protein DPMN_057516 [Dreissena polymorpha]
MCLMIYVLGSVILLAYGGQCELTLDNVYGMLSARLDTMLLEKNIMKKEQDIMRTVIMDLMTSMTATNQQLKDVAAAEVGQRTHLLRRGLEKEKAATQSRFNSVQKTLEKTQSDIKCAANTTRAQISTVERNLAATKNNTKTLQSRV